MKISIIILSIVFLNITFLHAADAETVFNSSNAENGSITWSSPSGHIVEIDPPEMIIKDWIQGKNNTAPLDINLQGKSTQGKSTVLNYSVFLDKTNYGISGTYKVTLFYDEKQSILKYETALTFDSPVRTDVNVRNNFTVKDESAKRILLPEREGVVRSFSLESGAKAAGRYELGAGSATGVKPGDVDYLRRFDLPQSKWFPGNGEGLIPGYGIEIGMPVVGLKLNEKNNIVVSFDPYCGGFIQAESTNEGTVITISTMYKGTKVPLKSEARDVVLEIIDSKGDFDCPASVNSMLMSFYKTVPEIKPGANWTHDIQLTYYDYLSDGGEGWFKGLQHLADRIPEEYRDRVVVCTHAWYDYFLRYAYDHEKGELVDEWIAFPGTYKIPMSIDKMHKRLNFAKELGFRTIIYFADGTNSDSGSPDFHPEYVLRNVDGDSRGGWKGPDSVGRPVRSDPSAPGLRDWFKGYLRAMLDEYGEVVDGFVWDETFYIPVNTISYSQKIPAYADRWMLSLVSDLTQMVQQYHDKNPNLVFLVSDWGNNSNGLVAHGTWEDTTNDPDRWHRSMFSNYRNSLWSNTWRPVSHVYHSYLASILGFPQGLSDGWRDDLGPHEMPQEILDGLLDRFLKNVKEGKQRPIYFQPDGEPVYYDRFKN